MTVNAISPNVTTRMTVSTSDGRAELADSISRFVEPSDIAAAACSRPTKLDTSPAFVVLVDDGVAKWQTNPTVGEQL
ncbi:hypothetical protein P3H15_43535 [Rhodococcus sp. T2V]|nr:hypothetical protein [Rhodococcus sp. T2V]MDF3311857.1 hypothetical protein [Rhodococcus sp. T2V]